MENSSKNAIDGRPAAASRRAHAGGASDTAPSGPITGRPAKSEGSEWVMITVSTCHPSPRADSTAAVLPSPGLPHSSTGTRALTQIPSACSVCS